MIQSYKDASGLAHWPDAPAGSEKYYAVDWTEFLTEENDAITAISWVVPAGLTNMAESQALNQARIKLSADVVGSYVVSCEILTVEVADTQKFIQTMNIEVI